MSSLNFHDFYPFTVSSKNNIFPNFEVLKFITIFHDMKESLERKLVFKSNHQLKILKFKVYNRNSMRST